MARIKHATSRAKMPLNGNRTRLPLALKPSNNSMSSSLSCTSESLSTMTTNIDTNSALSPISDLPSPLTPPKEEKTSSSTAKMKKTKSQTKALIIASEINNEDSEIQEGAEAQYDLLVSMHESGGIDRFLNIPCMILYKRLLNGQGKLFVCLGFNDSGASTDLENYILQHISSYSSNLCLFAGITGTIEFKHSVCGSEKTHKTKGTSDHTRVESHSSITTLKFAQIRNKNVEEEEKSDIENVDGNDCKKMNHKTTELEERDENIEQQIVSEDDMVEEETLKANVSVGSSKRKNINWKGGSKNCGLYMLLDKHEEVKECVNNVLSYGREHGVLMSGVQLKTLFDIQNVEITKNRACAIVDLISNNVEVVSNPHFLAPTAQKPLFEYYGNSSELAAVSPTKSIPIPRSIMIEYKKKNTNGGNKRGEEKEEERPLGMKKKKDAENCNSDDTTETMEINHKDHNISSSPDHLKRLIINNDREDINDDTDANSTPSPSEIKNAVERCSSPIPGRTDSSITICTEHQLSPLSSSWCTNATNDQTSLVDNLRSISPQRSNAAESNAKLSSSLLPQQGTPSQSKQTNVSIKNVGIAQASRRSKRRSYALRSKAKPNQPQLSNEHSDKAPSISSLKKGKIGKKTTSTENYQTLTKRFGKIPKKTHI
ncbi:unnamed protein product [Rotaria magnacalcarata]|uniref:Uncharacterized protein n=3 Tax=Rotaria magnacalcarata TaxID=392030 RepID=A0A815V5V8_9BILA|nr:unnamed protein product [Rotaria magnacalcarata]CAF1528833.1 unnamed protein product [Rotaria magnacalcarata]CAF3898748.1 unnamed protein product [Rotaria magnacalcarata]CAF3918124.1 unnamed protein product [Rotaria magnacalcarata]